MTTKKFPRIAITPPKKSALLTFAEIGVLKVLADSAINGVFYETAESLSHRADCHPRTIQRYLRSLVSQGLLDEHEPRRQDSKGWWLSATYCLPSASPATKSTVDPIVRQKMQTNLTEHRATKSTVGVNPTPNRATKDAEGAHPATNVALEANSGSRSVLSRSEGQKGVVQKAMGVGAPLKLPPGVSQLPDGRLVMKVTR